MLTLSLIYELDDTKARVVCAGAGIDISAGSLTPSEEVGGACINLHGPVAYRQLVLDKILDSFQEGFVVNENVRVDPTPLVPIVG